MVWIERGLERRLARRIKRRRTDRCFSRPLVRAEVHGRALDARVASEIGDRFNYGTVTYIQIDSLFIYLLAARTIREGELDWLDF